MKLTKTQLKTSGLIANSIGLIITGFKPFGGSLDHVISGFFIGLGLGLLVAGLAKAE